MASMPASHLSADASLAQPQQPHLGFCEAPDRLEAFKATLESARGSSLLIVLKGYPDPDSIASALAQQHIAQLYDIKSEIVFFNEISHPENRALVKILDAPVRHYFKGWDLSRYDYWSFVDTQTSDMPVPVEEQRPVLTFVDHHKITGRAVAQFCDIRESAGATCSIYSEYLEHAFPLDAEDPADVRLATALMHGIRTDTDNLMLATPIDYRAGAYLQPFIDHELLRQISHQPISARTMEIIQKALNNKEIRQNFLVSGVGFVREEDRDGIAQTADLLLRHEGVETVVVFGIVNNEMVDGSLRTNSATVDPDTWLKSLFGTDQAGRHYGGGRRSKGGFCIPLGIFARCRDRDALWAVGKKTIEDLIFDKLGVEPPEQQL